MRIGFFALIALFPLAGHAALLPVSRHGRLVSYATFGEDAMSLLVKDAHRAFLGLSQTFAIAEATQWWGGPQLTFGADVFSAFGTKAEHSFEYGAEAMNVRATLAAEWTPSPYAFSVGLYHASGHVFEGVAEGDLLPPDLGDDGVRARAALDIDDRWRFGATLDAVFKRAPDGRPLGLQGYAEYFPWGADSPSARAEASPYFAVSVGTAGYREYVGTFHCQAGLLVGHHFFPTAGSALRLAVGYYHGADPRWKYFAFRDGRADFVYFGFFANL